MRVLLLWTGAINKKYRIFLTGAFIPNALLLGTGEYHVTVLISFTFVISFDASRIFLCTHIHINLNIKHHLLQNNVFACFFKPYTSATMWRRTNARKITNKQSRRWTNVIKTLLQCLVSARIFLFSPLLCPLSFSHYVFFSSFLFTYSIKHEYTHSNGRALQNSCNIAKFIERFCKKIRTKLSAFLWEERLLSSTSIIHPWKSHGSTSTKLNGNPV